MDKALLKNDYKVETSEVVYKDQDLVNTDVFVKVEQFYSATGKYKVQRNPSQDVYVWQKYWWMAWFKGG